MWDMRRTPNISYQCSVSLNAVAQSARIPARSADDQTGRQADSQRVPRLIAYSLCSLNSSWAMTIRRSSTIIMSFVMMIPNWVLITTLRLVIIMPYYSYFEMRHGLVGFHHQNRGNYVITYVSKMREPGNTNRGKLRTYCIIHQITPMRCLQQYSPGITLVSCWFYLSEVKDQISIQLISILGCLSLSHAQLINNNAYFVPIDWSHANPRPLRWSKSFTGNSSSAFDQSKRILKFGRWPKSGQLPLCALFILAIL